MTSSYEFEKAQQELIAQQDALIRQLGEALELARMVVRCERDLYDAECKLVDEAGEAYNDWKARQS